MKTKFIVTGIIAVMTGAYSSGQRTSSSQYEDDIYYNPKTAATGQSGQNYSGGAMTAAESYTAYPADEAGMSDYERYLHALESGKTVDEATAAVKSAPVEYYDAPASSNGQNNNVYLESSQSKDGQGNTYITNNYYDDSYAARINRFSRPYYGYSYYDPWYYGPGANLWYDSYFGWGGSFSFGWGSPYYYPHYSAFYNPWYYGYNPYHYYPHYYGSCWDCYPGRYYQTSSYPSYRTRVSDPAGRRSRGLYATSYNTARRAGTSSAVSSSSRRPSAGASYRPSATQSTYTRTAADNRRRTTTTGSREDGSSITRTRESSAPAYTTPRTTTTERGNVVVRQRPNNNSSLSTSGSTSNSSYNNRRSNTSRSSSSYSAPSRSSFGSDYTAPSRSSGSTPAYSAPSRSSSSSSGGSYSSGRSSSSSGSSSSGGGRRR
jgi:hypothetical protein